LWTRKLSSGEVFYQRELVEFRKVMGLQQDAWYGVLLNLTPRPSQSGGRA
jgi:hypothetical protein